MYYIYHIPGVKIGVTKDLAKRMADQGFTDWEILEEHTNGWLAGDRELELQREHGYSVDTCHYMISLQNRLKATEAGNTPDKKASKSRKLLGNTNGAGAKGRTNDWLRKLSFEDAQEIRAKYIPRKYGYQKIADEYNVSTSLIFAIIANQTYAK